MLEQQAILNEKNWVPTSYGFFHSKENIKFVKISNRDSLKDVLNVFDLVSNKEKFGLICSSFKESDIQLLRNKRISYCIPDREIKIFSSQEDEIRVGHSLDGEHLYKINPTIIVSPSGLEITDTILKLDENEIQSSAANISKTYNLSRSKLSTMMTAFKVRTLVELKEKMLDLSISWWFESFNNPITKRKMTPFKTPRTRRYVFNGVNEISLLQEKVLKLKERNIDVEIGGLSYLKLLGVLRAPEFDILVRADQLIDVVEFLELRPAKKNEVETVVYLTPLIGNIKSEKLEARKPNWDARHSQYEQSSFIMRINVLRYLWGLNYEEERIKEERKSLLEDYLNEVRKRHY